MFDLWVLFTIGGALIQNGRTIYQKNLAGRLGVSGVTYARFFFGFPIAVAGLFTIAGLTDQPLPEPNAAFIAYTVTGGLAQIVANAVFVVMVGMANFTICTTYIKTEIIVAAVIAFLVLGDAISWIGVIGIIITLAGLLTVAAGRTQLSFSSFLIALRDRAAFYGLIVGTGYGIGSAFVRAGSLSLGGEGFALQAAYTLVWVVGSQVVIMGGWLLLRSPRILIEMLRAWRSSAWIGVFGVVASACWYLAFTLQTPAYVLAVGHVEIPAAYAISRFVYKEHINAAEFTGLFIMVAGILAVVLGG